MRIGAARAGEKTGVRDSRTKEGAGEPGAAHRDPAQGAGAAAVLRHGPAFLQPDAAKHRRASGPILADAVGRRTPAGKHPHVGQPDLHAGHSYARSSSRLPVFLRLPDEPGKPDGGPLPRGPLARWPDDPRRPPRKLPPTTAVCDPSAALAGHREAVCCGAGRREYPYAGKPPARARSRHDLR